ncbi:hypothetical protein MASR1M66_24240 [Aminivibrio sp.]
MATRLPKRVDKNTIPPCDRTDPLSKFSAILDHRGKEKEVCIRGYAIERKDTEHTVESTAQTGYRAKQVALVENHKTDRVESSWGIR